PKTKECLLSSVCQNSSSGLAEFSAHKLSTARRLALETIALRGGSSVSSSASWDAISGASDSQRITRLKTLRASDLFADKKSCRLLCVSSSRAARLDSTLTNSA